MYEYEKNENQYHFVPGGEDARFYSRPTYPTEEIALIEPVAEQEKEKPKKNRRFAKIAGMVAGMLIVSGVSGAGTALLVTNKTADAPAAPVLQSNMLQTAAVSTPAVTGSISAVAEKSAGSVVEITTEVKTNSMFIGEAIAQGAGSGVILTQDGYIVTNNHVIDGAQRITVRTNDGTEYDAKLIATDPKTDLSVVKIEASGLSPITFADSDSIQVGQLAIAIGNPLGELGGTVTSGIISATGRELTIEDESMTLLQTSAAVNPGNSGGGLFDENGNLVGIVNAKSAGSEIEGLGFAIPSNTVKAVTSELMDKGYVSGRPELGINAIEISDPRMAAMYQLNELGVYIAQASADSGFAMGDRIAEIDGTEITTAADISGILQKHSVGDTVKVTVIRNGREATVDVVLREHVPERTGTAV